MSNKNKKLDKLTEDMRDMNKSFKTLVGTNVDLSEEQMMEANDLVRKLNDLSGSNKYFVATALSHIYTKVSTERKNLVAEVDHVRNLYMTDVIITQFIEDALAPETTTGEIITVSSKNKKLDTELKSLFERINLDVLIRDIVYDFLAYGEYTLSTKTGENGIEALLDNVPQGSVVAVTESGELTGYIKVESSNSRSTVKLVEPGEYVKFILGNNKLRVDMRRELGAIRGIDKKVIEGLPDFVRVGKSLVFSIISKIKELDLLESLVPASKIAKLSSGNLVGLQFPQGYDVVQAIAVCKKVEGLINRKTGVDRSTGKISVENIMETAGTNKCVPVFGEKGQLQKMDYKMDEPDDMLASIEDLRKTICSSVGIPFRIIFGSEGDNKSDILKQNARYIRRLKNFHFSLSEGIKQIVFIHLSNMSNKISYKMSDIEVEFRNKLVDIDSLEKLEFIDSTISFLSSVGDFVDKLKETPDGEDSGVINQQGYIDFVRKTLKVVGVEGMINEKIEKPTPPADPVEPPVDSPPEGGDQGDQNV